MISIDNCKIELFKKNDINYFFVIIPAIGVYNKAKYLMYVVTKHIKTPGNKFNKISEIYYNRKIKELYDSSNYCHKAIKYLPGKLYDDLLVICKSDM